MLGQQFVVTAVKGGQRTVALFALGGDGAGGVTVLGRAHAAEPNDVLGSIGVPDVAQIRRAATGFFAPGSRARCWWTDRNRPRCTRGHSL